MQKRDTWNSEFSIIQKWIIATSPLILGILEIWHPVGLPGKTAFESISPQVNWWLLLHVLQLPLFGLIALSIVLLVKDLSGWAATVSRIGMACFIVFYPALDAITGIAGGLLIRSAQSLPPEGQDFVAQQLNLFLADPIVGGATFSVIGVLGALGWVVGVVAAALALAQAKVSFIAVGLLVLSALFFGLSHTPPTGPIGMACFLFAVIKLLFLENRSRDKSLT
jgi:hypothetical protein